MQQSPTKRAAFIEQLNPYLTEDEVDAPHIPSEPSDDELFTSAASTATKNITTSAPDASTVHDSIHLHRQRLNRFHQSAKSLITLKSKEQKNEHQQTQYAMENKDQVQLDTIRLANFHQQAVSFLDRAYANDSTTLITEEQLSPNKLNRLKDKQLLESFHKETINMLNASVDVDDSIHSSSHSNDNNLVNRKYRTSNTFSNSSTDNLIRIERDKARLQQHYQDVMSFLNRVEKEENNRELVEEQEIEIATVERMQLQRYAREAMSFLDKAFSGDSSVLVDDDDEDDNHTLEEQHLNESFAGLKNMQFLSPTSSSNNNNNKSDLNVLDQVVYQRGHSSSENEKIGSPSEQPRSADVQVTKELKQQERSRNDLSDGFEDVNDVDDVQVVDDIADSASGGIETEDNVNKRNNNNKHMKKVKSSKRQLLKNASSIRRKKIKEEEEAEEENRQIAEDRAALERYDEEIGDFLDMAYDNVATIMVDDADSETSGTTGGGDRLYARRMAPSTPSADDSSSYIADEDEYFQQQEQQLREEEMHSEYQEGKERIKKIKNQFVSGNKNGNQSNPNASLHRRMKQYELDAGNLLNGTNVSEEYDDDDDVDDDHDGGGDDDDDQHDANDYYFANTTTGASNDYHIKSEMVKNFNGLTNDYNQDDIDGDIDTSSSSINMNKFSKSDSFKPKQKNLKQFNARSKNRSRRKINEKQLHEKELKNNEIVGPSNLKPVKNNLKPYDKFENDNSIEGHDNNYTSSENDFHSKNKNLTEILLNENNNITESEEKSDSDNFFDKNKIHHQHLENEQKHTEKMSKNLSPGRKHLNPTDVSGIDSSIGDISLKSVGKIFKTSSSNPNNKSNESNDLRMDLRFDDGDGKSGGWQNIQLASTFYRQIPRGTTVKLRPQSSINKNNFYDDKHIDDMNIKNKNKQNIEFLSERKISGINNNSYDSGSEQPVTQPHPHQAYEKKNDYIPLSVLQRVEKERNVLIATLEQIINERSMLAKQVKEMKSILPERRNDNIDHNNKNENTSVDDSAEIDLAEELREAHSIMAILTQEMDETLTQVEERNQESLEKAQKLEDKCTRLQANSFRMEGELAAKEKRISQGAKEEKKLRENIEALENKVDNLQKEHKVDLELKERLFRDEKDRSYTKTEELNEEVRRLKQKLEQNEQLIDEQKKAIEKATSNSHKGFTTSVKRSLDAEILSLKNSLNEQIESSKSKREEIEKKWRQRERENIKKIEIKNKENEDRLENEIDSFKKEVRKLKNENLKMIDETGMMERRRAIAEREAEEARRRQRVTEAEVTQLRSRVDASMREKMSRLSSNNHTGLKELQEGLKSLRDNASRREQALERQLEEFKKRTEAAEIAASAAEKDAKEAAEMVKVVQEKGKIALEEERAKREKAENERDREREKLQAKIDEEKNLVNSPTGSGSGGSSVVGLVKSSSRRALRKSTSRNRDAEKEKKRKEKDGKNNTSVDGSTSASYAQRRRSNYRALFFG